MNFIEKSDNIKYELYLTKLNEETVRKISLDQNEPKRMLDHRLKCLKLLESMKLPSWWPDLSWLDIGDLVRYARPTKEYEWYTNDRTVVPEEIKDKFEKLWIPQAERKYLAGAWWQMDSTTVYHKLKQQRESKWVIFEDMSIALTKYPELVKKYFMKCVNEKEHYFACLHGAIWSGWTFIYLPKWVEMNQPLQAYFRMNTYWWWQFEHTLIIVEENAKAEYIEWCSAPKFDKASLHAGLVEIFVNKNASMKYISVENWSKNTYNLNTKRAIVEENGYIQWLGGNMWSFTTMLYPCSVLKWKNSKSDSFGLSISNSGQNQDIWSKVIHIWENTSSQIISKSISKWDGIATYRWLVKILPSAKNSHNLTKCDGLLVDEFSVSKAVPDISVQNDSSIVSHEASAGKINEDFLFYLQSRWISEIQAQSMIVNGFLSDITKKLPLEYAWEFNKLIQMEFE